MNGDAIMSTSSHTACALAVAAGALLGGDPAAFAQCQDPRQMLSIPEVGDIAMAGYLLAARAELGGRPALVTYRGDSGEWRFSDDQPIQNTGPLALSGDLLVVGRGSGDPRTVEVYRRRDTSARWWLEAILSTALPSDEYGRAVAVSGDTVLVGEARRGDPGLVHFYGRGASGWEHEATLAAPAEHGSFGEAVAIDGALAAVHADIARTEGAVVMYRHDGAAWALEADIRVPKLGYGSPDIDLDDDRLIVTTENPGGPARIYRFDGAQWMAEARLLGVRASEWRDTTVALEGERALVVAQWRDALVDSKGVAYLYTLGPEGWAFDRRLLLTGDPATSLTGAVALRGEEVALVAAETVRLYATSHAPGACPPAPDPDPDNGLLVQVNATLSPQTPSARVLIRGHFRPTSYALAGAIFDVRADEPGWADPRLLLLGPGTSAGLIEGTDVVDSVVGQLNSPTAGIYADPSNPIDVWEAEFRATDFSPRIVTVRAETFAFAVYPVRETSVSEHRIRGVLNPEATIRVWRSSCLADCDGSGELDIFDFLCFQGLFAAGNLACDFDEDGMLTLFDFLAFQNEFAGGCL